jgi:hypothetical protein
VILVHDVVAGAEVGERLQCASAEAALARHTAAEDLVIGEEDEAELAPDEAAAGGRDREEKLRLLRQLVSRLQHARLHPAQEVLGAKRLAAMREGDDDALARAQERRELALGLGEAAGGDRGPLRLEGERLGLWERVELRRARQRGGREDAVLLPDPAHVVRLKDEVRWPFERGHEVVRSRGHDRLLILRPK